MTAVKALHIHGLRDSLHRSFPCALTQMSNVTTLVLECSTVLNFTQLRRILFAFGNLAHLTISKVHFVASEHQQWDDGTRGIGTHRMRLRTIYLDLSLSAMLLVPLIGCLVKVGACRSVTELGLESPWLASPSDVVINSVNTLVRTAGPSLLRLSERIACEL